MSTFSLEEVQRLQEGGNEARARGCERATHGSAPRAVCPQVARAKYLARFSGSLPDFECVAEAAATARLC